MAPAPIAWTSTRVWLRTTPAMAPATATGFEVAETFKISMAGRVRGIPAAGLAESVFSPVEPFDGGVVSRVSIYSIEIGDRTFGWPRPDTLTPRSGVVKRLLDAYLSIDPLHPGRLARKGIDLGQHRVELHHPSRHLEAV